MMKNDKGNYSLHSILMLFAEMGGVMASWLIEDQLCECRPTSAGPLASKAPQCQMDQVVTWQTRSQNHMFLLASNTNTSSWGIVYEQELITWKIIR